ncbi:MAG: M1 family metallopeptidase, partial [Chloroflexi bacterium]|nr:M1 family metallopeptidase [Chloroflexota bacterium]
MQHTTGSPHPTHARRRISVCVACLFLALSGCVQPRPLQATYTPQPVEDLPLPVTTLEPTLPVFTPDAVPTLSPAPTDVAAALPPAGLQYRFLVALDYAGHTAAVTQGIRYTNDTGETLDTLPLLVEPNRRWGAFRLIELLDGQQQPIPSYRLEDALLSVPLEPALVPGETRDFFLTYELHPPEDDSWFAYTRRQFNLADWYPMLPPYLPDKGWIIKNPGTVGEHLAYAIADYSVEITLVGDTDVVLAASAPAEQTGDGFHYELRAGRNFAISASPDYVRLEAQAGQVQVYGYVYPEHQASGAEALRATADALQLYSELFSPYPHASISFVEADFPDGMEHQGLYWLTQFYFEHYTGTQASYLTTLAVHETAHQWWYGIVGNNQALEPWLDEALCTYTEQLYYEKRYPALVDWWWDYRVNTFLPTGYVNSTIYDHKDYRPYVNAVYLRGAQFLRDLRRTVGDEAFFAFLQAYPQRYHGQIASGEDFF